ncbi:GFA family protein [Shewanella algae]
MKPQNELQGGCLCGAIRYRLEGEPFDADHCYCSQCRKSTGAVVGSWMDFRLEQLTWQGETVREYASSAKIRRGFCPNCGTSLSYRSLDYPEFISLSIASLDDPDRVAPRYHIYCTDKPAWLQITDDCPRYPSHRSQGG